MTDKVKTPEELAEHTITLLKRSSRCAQEPLTKREEEIAYSVFLAGYEAARQQPIVITQEHTIAEFKED